MPSINHKISFVLLWFLVGIVHWSFGIAVLQIWTSFNSVQPDALFGLFVLLTLLALPARKFLLSHFLGLQLEGWTKKTIIGTIAGIILAYLSFWILGIILFLFFYRPYYGEPTAWDNFLSSLQALSLYLVFRFVLINRQFAVMQRPQGYWLYASIGGAILLWLTFAFHFAGFAILPSSIALILPNIAAAVSELLVAYGYVKMSTNLPIAEKRKVEEM